MKLPKAVAGKLARPMLKLRKASPQLMFAAGAVGVVTAGVLACRSTLKIDEVLEKAETRELTIKKLTSDGFEGFEQDKFDGHMTRAKVKLVLDMGKLYLPAVSLAVVSIGLLTGSHVTLTRRNAAAVAAYATVEEAYRRYRDGVIEKYGTDEDERFRHGVTVVEETVTDDNGKNKKVKRERSAGRSEYSRVFTEGNVNWQPQAYNNWFFLNAQQAHWNDRLQTYGHVFLNEVYDSLGMERTKAGAVVGWIAGENGRDGYISFGIDNDRSESVRDFMTGAEASIVLDFNVDGVVYDKI